MKKLQHTLTGLAIAVALTLGGAAHAAVFAISFESGDIDQTGSGGLFWDGVTGSSPAIANITATDGTTATGVALSTINAGGFVNGGRGANAAITENGVTFPGAVNVGYVADNLDGTTRDGLMVFRFTAPNTTEFQVWEFTISTSYNHNNPTAGAHTVKFNVGGSYAAKDFTGGTTLSLESADNDATPNVDAGVLTANATNDGSNYIIELQVGYAGDGNKGNGGINGLHVSTSAIPEPASLALLGLGGLCLLGGRSRRA